MNNYRKPDLLTTKDIQSFRNIEINKIKVMVLEEKPQIKKLSNIKIGLLTIIPLIVIVIMLSLNNKENPQPQPQPQYLSEIYEDFTLYTDRLDTLQTNTTETHKPKTEFLNTYEYITYTREELLTHLKEFTNTPIDGHYQEQLFTARLFVSGIKEAISDDLDKEVGEVFYPVEGNNKLTYKFIVNTEGYIIIDVNNNGFRSYIKLGLNNDILQFEEIHYNFDSRELNVLTENDMNYNYFSIVEDGYAVYTLVNETRALINYTSLIDNTHFVVDYTEDKEFSEAASDYTVNYYDYDSSLQVFLSILDNEIISETYDIMDQYGLLYRYQDTDTTDSEVSLATRFIEATGYDYVKVNTQSGASSDEEGLYLTNGDPVYLGYLNFTLNDYYLFGSVKQTIQKDNLSNEHFSLETLNLNLNHEKANLAYFETMKVDNISELEDIFTYGEHQFFSGNIKEELYQIISTEIRVSLEEDDDPQVVIGEDIELLQQKMLEFTNTLDITGELRIIEQASLKSSEQTVTVSTYTGIDIHDFYYRTRRILPGEPSIDYILYAYNDRLMELTGVDRYYDYQTLYEEANKENFMSFIDIVSNLYHIENGVETVTKISDNEYQITGNQNILFFTSEHLFFDSYYYGFNDLEVEATITFIDESTYTLSFSASTLSNIMNGNQYTYEGTRTYSIEEAYQEDILSDPTKIFSLPKSAQSVIFTYNVNDHGYLGISLEPGDGYVGYYLEEGYYEFGFNDTGLYDVEIAFTDSEGNITVNQSNIHVDEPGVYYVRISSERNHNTTLEVRKQVYDFDNIINLTEPSGTQTITHEENVLKVLSIPKVAYDRYLKIEIDWDTVDMETYNKLMFLLKPENNVQMNGFWYFRDEVERGYFYLEANKDYYIVTGAPQPGDYTFDYEIITAPSDGETITEINIPSIQEHPDIILNTFQNEMTVHFEVTSPITIDFFQYYYGYSRQYEVTLYHESGVEVTDFQVHRTLELTTGNYYFVYTIKQEDTHLIVQIDYHE